MEETALVEDRILELDELITFFEQETQKDDFKYFDRLKGYEQRINNILPKIKVLTYDDVENVVLENLWGGTRQEFYDQRNYKGGGIVFVRYFLFLFCKLLTKLTLAQIGLPLRKDYTTVLHGINTLQSQMIYDVNRITFETLVLAFAQRGFVVPQEIVLAVLDSQKASSRL
jgi:hypothetical protein